MSNEPSTPLPGTYGSLEQEYADLLHSGQNLPANAVLTPELEQIKKLRNYIRTHTFAPNYTDDEAYNLVASLPGWMTQITGSPAMGPLSEATNFRGSLLHTRPSSFSSSPRSLANKAAEREADNQELLRLEEERGVPLWWGMKTNGTKEITQNTRNAARRNEARVNRGLPPYTAAVASGNGNTLVYKQNLKALREEMNRLREEALKRGPNWRALVRKSEELQAQYEQLLAAHESQGGRRNRKTRKSNRRSRRSTRRN